MCAKLIQLHPTLCDVMGHSIPGSSVHKILQAKIQELSCPPSRDLPDPGIKPESLTLDKYYHSGKEQDFSKL